MTDDPQHLHDEIARLQKQVATLQQNYDNLFQNIGDSVFIIDLNTYTILATNDHALRRFGYTQAEIVGKSLDDIEVNEPSDSQQLAWESSFSGTRIYECQYRHRDGTLIPVEVSSRVVMMNGRDVIQNFVRHIKIRKQLEAEREQLIQDLDNFAHTVAHDLKNPLAVIISYTNFLRDSFKFMSEDELNDGFDFLYREGQRTITIIEELLLFASIQRQDQIQLTPLDMNAILSEVQSRLAHMMNHHNATLEMPKTWGLAVGYASWVAEIWMNYISNAVKYGGTPPVIEIGSTVEGDMVRFWVRDNGAGIPAHEIPRLFSQFTQLRHIRVDGHGLGLSIVKRIAERLGGGVHVESQLGQGSIFSFTLPAYQPS